MRGRPWKLVVVSGLVLSACVGNESQLPMQPVASTTTVQSCNATRINELIDALFPAGTPRTAAHNKFASIQDKMSRGKTADARQKMFDLVKTTLADLKARKLLVPRPSIASSTQAAVSELFFWLYQCVGLPQPGDLSSALDPAGSGAAAVIGPTDPATDVTTGDRQAGISIPTGAISTSQTVLVTVAPSADQTSPLPTSLPQYGPFYDFHTFPPVAKFAQQVTIGICVTVPPAVAGRVQLARPDAASPTTAVELLARGPAGGFLGCSPLPLASLRVEGEPLAGVARPGLLGRLLAAAATLLRPAPLQAEVLQAETTGSVTAKVDNADYQAGAADAESHLVFTTQPPDTFAYEQFYPAVEVTVQASDGTTMKSYQGDVTVALGDTPAVGTLSGTLTRPVVNGVARFDDLRLDHPGSGYTLVATVSGDVPTPTPATSAAFDITVGPFKGVSAGFEQTCGLTLAGRVFCWGHNALGQLGDGTTVDHLTPLPIVMPDGVTEFASVTSGASFVCALTADGRAYCWGGDFYGQVGDGNTTNDPTPLPAAVLMPSGVSFASLSAFGSSACGLTDAGEAYCWGYNAYGQLGIGNTIDQSRPVKVELPPGVTFTSLTAGEVHTCGLTAAGEAWCWGDNSVGQLGDGTTTSESNPVLVSPSAPMTFASITAGGAHTCAITLVGGAAYCWGSNTSGQLGNANTTSEATPTAVSVPVGESFSRMTAGGIHTCALSAGAAWCWGSNNNGQIGNESSIDALTPVAVTSVGMTFASLSLSIYQSCGLTPEGRAFCWGDNWAGQLGDGTTTDQPIPTPVKQ